MNKPKLIGTEEYCKKLLQDMNDIKENHLLGFGWFIEDTAYNVRNNETIRNDKEIYNAIEDKIFGLINTLEDILNKEE